MNKTLTLNHMQQQIYDEYKQNGKVWAECNRQTGKTTLLVHIAKEETKKNNKVLILNKSSSRKNIIENIKRADVVLCDEIYYDPFWLGPISYDKKIVCLRTPLHKTLRFNEEFEKQQTIENIIELPEHWTIADMDKFVELLEIMKGQK